MSPPFNLEHIRGRTELVLTLARLYRLLSRLGAVLPPLASRLPLFVPLPTHEGTTIECQGDCMLKKIANWNVFSSNHCTTLTAVKQVHPVEEHGHSSA